MPFSLKDIFAIFRIGGFAAFIIFIISLLIILANDYNLPFLDFLKPYLTPLKIPLDSLWLDPEWVNFISACSTIFFFFLWIKSIWSWCEERYANIKYKKAVMNYFHNLPTNELQILAYHVTINHQVFTAPINNKHILPLLSKGIVEYAPIQIGSQLDWPFQIQKDVWKYLVANKEDYVITNANEIRNPFSFYGVWSR